jgi:hypothetical protein
MAWPQSVAIAIKWIRRQLVLPPVVWTEKDLN